MEEGPMDAKFPRNSRLMLLGLALLLLSQGGCLFIAAGAAGGAALGYVWTQGQLNQTYPAAFNDTWTAARAALTDLGMPIQSEEHDNNTGFLKSQTRDGETVRINLDVKTSKFPSDGPLTHVGVRVGAFGDQAASTRILDQIGTHLTPTGVPATASPTTWSAVAPPAPPPPPTTTAPPPLATTPPPPLLPPEPVSKTTGPK
jgi:hypothetical protein